MRKKPVKKAVDYVGFKAAKETAKAAVNQHYNCTIVIEGSLAKLEGTFPLGPVQDVTSFYGPGYRFAMQYKTGVWDGRTKLFHRGRKTFPAGLAQDVLKALRKEKVKVMLDDRRSCPGSPDTTQNSLHGVSFDYPYEYQPEHARVLCHSQRGIAAVATNGGKTVIAALAIKMLRLPTLFMVPNLDLLYQTQRVLEERLGIPIGVIGDSHWNEQLVTVASVGTLWSRIGKKQCRSFLNKIQVLIIDECHHVGADTWYKVLKFCNAFYRWGLSGTPLKRSDGADLKLIGMTGPVLIEVRNKELIERGISVKPYIHFVEINKPLIPKKVPWQEAYKKGIVDNAHRNNALCRKVGEFVEKGLSVFVLVREIAHGQTMDKKMPSSVRHQFLCGDESPEARIEALGHFRSGKLKVIIATSIFDEGVDIPNIDVLVLAGGGKSSINTLQRVGRGLRKGGNIDRLYIVDTIDFHQYHLLKHSMQRLKDYKSEDCFEIEEISK